MEPVRLAEARGKVYALMAYLYSQLPDTEWLKRLWNGLAEVRAYAGLGTEKAKRSEQSLLRGVEKLQAGRKKLEGEEALVAIRVERTRLFRGIGPDYGPPPPYESVYRDEGAVMGQSSTEVARYYKETGYHLPEGWREPPDHIGAELGFMEYLCQQEAQAWSRGDEQQARAWQQRQGLFLSRHLKVWAPRFCREVKEKTQSDLFRGLAQITRSFLEMERARFAGSKRGAAVQG